MSYCAGSKFVKYLWILVGTVFLAGAIISLTSCGKKENTAGVLYYTCGMHPSVRIAPEDYQPGETLCPICNMKLTPVYQEKAAEKQVYYGCGVDTEGKCPHCDLGQADGKCICGQHSFIIEGKKINCPVCQQPLRELSQQESAKLKGVVSRVKIKDEQIRRAGVNTEPVSKQHLFKQIRTVGKVAFDPGLAVAQEEFLASLNSLEKIEQGNVPEIKARAGKLLESAKRKLLLLGLSQAQIEELENKQEVQTSLILPEQKMWIYGNVYEYELGWVAAGAKVLVSATSFPGEEFPGEISSVNPVVDSKTRSVRFRAEVDNPELKLRPEMYVDVVIQSMYVSAAGEHLVLAIPKAAVLDTGLRRIVWVDLGEGEFEGREAQLGPQASAVVDGQTVKFYPVLGGLAEGEQVVTKANFLIDSQSQLSGVAASAYGGALGAEAEPQTPAQLHLH
ncbi:efflux RND transporter periplasmic adaptor subunit [Candidatus Omnitrophota bacterium]